MHFLEGQDHALKDGVNIFHHDDDLFVVTSYLELRVTLTYANAGRILSSPP